MKKQNLIIIIIISITIVIIAVSGIGLYSFLKTEELKTQLKLAEEKTKQEALKNEEKKNTESITTVQSNKNKSDEQVITSNVKRTNYEAELMDRVASIPENNMTNANEVFEAWDYELNKIYKLLMSKLSENEKIKLRNKQRAWLKKKEKEMERAAEEMSGGRDENGNLIGCGTGCGHASRAVNIEMTKEKTIELARMYDELHQKK